jgi:hypothetical protein
MTQRHLPIQNDKEQKHLTRLSLQDWHPDRDLCLLLTWRGAFPTVDGVVDSVTSI